VSEVKSFVANMLGRQLRIKISWPPSLLDVVGVVPGVVAKDAASARAWLVWSLGAEVRGGGFPFCVCPAFDQCSVMDLASAYFSKDHGTCARIDQKILQGSC